MPKFWPAAANLTRGKIAPTHALPQDRGERFDPILLSPPVCRGRFDPAREPSDPRSERLAPRGELLAPWVKLLAPWVKLLAPRVRLLAPWVKPLAPRVRLLAPWVKPLAPWVKASARRLGLEDLQHLASL